MANAVEHADPTAPALLGGMTGGLEAPDQLVLQGRAICPSPHLFHHPALALLNGRVLSAQCLGSAPAHDRPRQVAIIKIAGMPGKNIEHDGFVRAQGATAALVQGTVEMAWSGVSDMAAQMTNENIRVIAISADQRLPSLPDIPSIAEFYPLFTSG